MDCVEPFARSPKGLTLSKVIFQAHVSELLQHKPIIQLGILRLTSYFQKIALRVFLYQITFVSTPCNFFSWEFRVPSIIGVESAEPSLSSMSTESFNSWSTKDRRIPISTVSVAPPTPPPSHCRWKCIERRWEHGRSQRQLQEVLSALLRKRTSFLIFYLRPRSKQCRAQIKINWPG